MRRKLQRLLLLALAVAVPLGCASLFWGKGVGPPETMPGEYAIVHHTAIPSLEELCRLKPSEPRAQLQRRLIDKQAPSG